MFVRQAALVQVAFADDVVLAKQQVAFIFLPSSLEGDPGFGEFIAGADTPRRDGGDAGALRDGRSLSEPAQAHDTLALGDYGHLVAGGGDNLSAGADHFAEGTGSRFFDADAQHLLPFGTDFDVPVVAVLMRFFVFMIMALLMGVAAIQHDTQRHEDIQCFSHLITDLGKQSYALARATGLQKGRICCV